MSYQIEFDTRVLKNTVGLTVAIKNKFVRTRAAVIAQHTTVK